jgi:hypothetical protein
MRPADHAILSSDLLDRLPRREGVTAIPADLIDCRRVNPLKLRLTDQGIELPLHEGVQAIARDAGGLHAARDDAEAAVRFCIDRRGVWLTVGEGAGSVHVNGRRVRRMAMLRAGDAIYVDGIELVLADTRAIELPDAAWEEPFDADPRVVLRGVGGKHHGRSFTLEQPRLVGSAVDADIRIDDPAFPERHARFCVSGTRIVLQDLGNGEGSMLNGQPVRDAVLQPGDQIVFDAQHRFVVEAPGANRAKETSLDFASAAEPEPAAESGRRRWSWLLLAALLIACALAVLLLFGSGR